MVLKYPDNTIWYVQSSKLDGSDKAEGSAVAIRLQKRDQPQTAKTYLLTCGHVVRGSVEGKRIIYAWPPDVGHTEGEARRLEVDKDFKELPTGKLSEDELRNAADDWVILRFEDGQAIAGIDIVRSWIRDEFSGDVRTWGYPGGKLSFLHGKVIPTRTDTFPFRDAAQGLIRLIGNGARPGISGGGVFSVADMQFAGLHRGRLDEALEVSAVSALHIRRRFGELGYEPSTALEGGALPEYGHHTKHHSGVPGLNMAPEPPETYIQRPKEYDAIRDKILKSVGTFVGITTALRGAGGYGKTTLARKLAHDPAVVNAHPDGVLWVELGEQCDEAKILALIADLIRLIDPSVSSTIQTIDAARAAFGKALADKRFLLIVDDVWERHHLVPFQHGGLNTTRLITSRFDPILPQNADRQVVDAMTPGESLSLISWDLRAVDNAAQINALSALAKRLGGWPQLLKLANGFLRDRLKYMEPLDRAIRGLEKRYDARGLDALGSKVARYEDRHQSVAAVLETSLELLDEAKRARFGELGIFPEDVDIPIGIVARLWSTTGGLDEFTTEDLLRQLANLSLLLNLDLKRRTIRFHDTTRKWLQFDARNKGQLSAQNKRLTQAISDIRTGKQELQKDETEYYYRYLPLHLADAGDTAALDALLLDPQWLEAKLSAIHSPLALVTDYVQFGRLPIHNLIGDSLRLSSRILDEQPRQLIPQLMGRLVGCQTTGAEEFIAKLALKPPMILPRTRSLYSDEIARFERSGLLVEALISIGTNEIIVGWSDGLVQLCNIRYGQSNDLIKEDGKVPKTLAQVNTDCVAVLWTEGSMSIVNVRNRIVIAELPSYENKITALAHVKDKILCAGRIDGGVEIIKYENGAFERNEIFIVPGSVLELCPLFGTKLVISCGDGTVIIFNTVTDIVEQIIENDDISTISSLAVFRDKYLVLGFPSSPFKFWGNLDVCVEKFSSEVLSGQSDLLDDSDFFEDDDDVRLFHIDFERGGVGINDLTALDASRVAIGSNDAEIYLWDVPSDTTAGMLLGHRKAVSSLTAVSDSVLASGSYDGTVRIWDINRNDMSRLQSRHNGRVNCLIKLDGLLASGGNDQTIRLWDIASGGVVSTHNQNPKSQAYHFKEGEFNWEPRENDPKCLATAQNWMDKNYIWIGSGDGTLRAWNLRTKSEDFEQSFGVEGNSKSNPVMALGCLSDGRFIVSLMGNECHIYSGSEKQATLSGHSDQITGLAVLEGDDIATCSKDGTLRIWDCQGQCKLLKDLGGIGYATCLQMPQEGRFFAGMSNGCVMELDPNSLDIVDKWSAHNHAVNVVAVNNIDHLVSGSDDCIIKLWQSGLAHPRAQLQLEAPISSAVFLSNSKLAIGDELGNVHWLKLLL